jgi:Type II/IV secretion system protein
VGRPARSGCGFLESSGVRFSEAHGHAGDTSDDIRLLRIRKSANLATRVGIRNRKEMAFADFAPTANIFLSQLGEIRSGEAFDLLQLLNTGHSGTLSTIHASSAKQGLARFTSCVLQSGVELPYRAVKSNIGDSLNVVVQIERRPGRRFISEVLEIKSYDPDADLFDLCAIYLAPRDNS